MQNQININIAVDVVKALSNKSLYESTYLMDNSIFCSLNKGTESLCTACQPGQIIHWVVYAVDLQTPVAIRNITFISSDGQAYNDVYKKSECLCNENPDLKTWIGVLPYMVLGKEYRYRLELQMGNGNNSIMSIDTPSLIWRGFAESENENQVILKKEKR